jgi:hypothetical protein
MVSAFRSFYVLVSSWKGIVCLKASSASRSEQRRGPTSRAAGDKWMLRSVAIQLQVFLFQTMRDGFQKNLHRLSCAECGQAAVEGLPQQISQRKLSVRAAARVGQVFLDEFPEPESLIQFAYPNQAAVRGDSGILEIDLRRGVEGELKVLTLTFTHRVLTSGVPSSR